jgi:hypothetical protein
MINDRNTYLTMAIQPAQFALHMTLNAAKHADGEIDRMSLQLIADRLEEAVKMLQEESQGITK